MSSQPRIAFCKTTTEIARRVPVFAAFLLLACEVRMTALAADGAIEFNLLELPSSRQAQVALQTPAGFYWDQTSLREGLHELGKVYGVSIWLDRQIDPTQSVSTSVGPNESVPKLMDRLQQIAALVGCEVGLIENVVYFGPVGKVASLQRAAVALHDKTSRASGSQQATLRDLSWPELATSAELLELLQRQWGIRLDAELEHDLFHEGRLLPSTLATQLTLVLGGFDMEGQWIQGKLIRSKPLDRQTRWQANYRKADLNLQNLGELTRLFAGSQCQTRNAVCQVAGVTDFHIALLATAQRTVAPVTNLRTQRWELVEVQNKKLDDVLNAITSSVGVELVWDAACTPAMRTQLVSFTAEKATLDELLAEVARASMLKILRDGSKVKILP